MKPRRNSKEEAAERNTFLRHNTTLARYLHKNLRAGRSVCDLAREFKVSRHTIDLWMVHAGISRQTRIIVTERTDP
jgi:hypothetical protein